ncbi:ATP-binding protein [Deinococcus sp.]|uniref:ATP-binding protein n=1 Tax=Deinococcus sp. TaxID=47478 RepID=UPI003B595FDC
MIGLSLLGNAKIQMGETALRLPTRRAQALCAYLALEGGAARSKLISLLWEDNEEASARVNLRQELRRIRATPIGAHLKAEGDYLSLDDALPVDVRQFQHHTAQLDFLAALNDYGGPLLDGTDFFDAPELQRWLDGQRERLTQCWQDTAAAQAERLEAGGELRGALELWQQLLRADELRERSYAEAMRLHLRLGEREAALKQFERCQAVLHSELGLSPLPETLRLAEQARSAHTAPTPTPTAVPASASPAFSLVGRQEAWAELRRRPPVALLLGEPGIGKTALARAACGNVKVLTLLGQELAANTPFSPATAALERHLAGLTDTERSALLPLLPGKDLPPDPALRASFRRTVARIIGERLGADGILLLEDLHWFDSATCEMLPEVLARCRQVGTWVIATARPHELAQNAAAAHLLPPGTLRLTLGPLESADLWRLVQDWTSHPPDAEFVSWLDEATAGNPLAVRETLRLLRVSQGEGPLSVPPESEAAPVRALILTRLEHLGAPSKRVLEAASVCSGAFSLAELAGTTALDEWTCLELLEGAVLAGLLEEDGGLFRFAHDLIRRAVVSSLSPARAALLHRHMAAVLDKSGGSPSRLAQHLEAAGDDASVWWWKAALAAEQVYAYQQALSHSQLALEGRLAPELRLKVHRRRLLWWRTLDDRSGWQTEVERLEALAYREGSALWWIEARLARLDWLFNGGRYHEVLELGASVLQDPNADTEQHARALLECGNAQMQLGRYQEAQHHLRGALALGGITLEAQPELYGRLNHSLTASALKAGDLKTATAHAELARQGFERAGSRMGQLRSLFNSFAIADRSGALDEAHTFGMLALELTRDMEDRQNERMALFNLTSLAIKAEEAEMAQSLMVEVEVLIENEADQTVIWWAKLHRAELARMTGQLGEAVTLLSDIHLGAKVAGNELFRSKARLETAELLLDMALPGQAQMVLRHGEPLAELDLPDRKIIDARLLSSKGKDQDAAECLEQVLRREHLEESRTRDRLILHLANALLSAQRRSETEALLAGENVSSTPSIQARKASLALRLGADRDAVGAAQALLASGNVPPIERLELLRTLAATVPQQGDYQVQADELGKYLAASFVINSQLGDLSFILVSRP